MMEVENASKRSIHTYEQTLHKMQKRKYLLPTLGARSPRAGLVSMHPEVIDVLAAQEETTQYTR